MQKSKASANKKSSKKRVIDSDSEYDSEMDDFIDDGDAGVDVSSMIKDIFGYDKNKFVESMPGRRRRGKEEGERYSLLIPQCQIWLSIHVKKI